MTYHAWQVNRSDEKVAALLAAKIGAPKLLARVLTARGYDTPEKAMGLLGEDAVLSDPFLMKDMDKAVERILQAVDAEEPIVVFGEYDVDGVTATALLFSHLRSMGANVRCMLPSREGDGYGLSERTVRRLAEKGYKLIITVDNGISAAAEAELAAELGMDVVITDHHLPPEQLPRAVAVVDPMRVDDTSPYKGFSGAGVAFKLCAALDGCDPEALLEFCGDLAAVGTVADVMDLTGENHTLVRRGLEVLQNSERPGLLALMEASGLSDRPVNADTVSYTLAPRLNAAGRMESAALALQLLLCEDEDRAVELAERLNQCNQARQAAEQEILTRVQAQLDADPDRKNDRVLLVWGE
ncbi:MAG: DHH family phosphoesterase, partial [Oscillospiraceae bacterium]|nr:DHH family phosphoesterase [Oscillospiraceae bacterium]